MSIPLDAQQPLLFRCEVPSVSSLTAKSRPTTRVIRFISHKDRSRMLADSDDGDGRDRTVVRSTNVQCTMHLGSNFFHLELHLKHCNLLLLVTPAFPTFTASMTHDNSFVDVLAWYVLDVGRGRCACGEQRGDKEGRAPAPRLRRNFDSAGKGGPVISRVC